MILIDDRDRHLLDAYRWVVGKHGYVIAGKNNQAVYLHRLILGATEGQRVDHINGIRTDCRRSNLRLVTAAQNARNRGQSRNNTSGYKGVSWDKHRRAWKAYIGYGGRVRTLGFFGEAKDAARAYDAEAQRVFGEYARTNDSLLDGSACGSTEECAK